MNIFDLFRRVETWTPEELRQYLEAHSPADYQLVDVRQPREYEQGHLPGAVHIPIGELDDRVTELDPSKMTVAY